MLFARASLKHCGILKKPSPDLALSRAFCAGLIEALPVTYPPLRTFSYPVLFARASLKPRAHLILIGLRGKLSRAFCAGLIEARRDL